MGEKLGYDKYDDRYVKSKFGRRFRSARGATRSEANKEYKQWYDDNFGDDQQELAEIDQAIETASKALALVGEKDFGHTDNTSLATNLFKLALEHNRINPPIDKTINNLMGQWIAGRKVDDDYKVVLRSHVKCFLEVCGDLTPMEITLDNWQHYDAKAKEKGWSDSYRHDVLVTVRGFFKSLYNNEIIDVIPRFVMNPDYQVPKKFKKVKFFDVPTVKNILTEANDEQKLHYMLMLNCGMTQKDLSELTWDQIDFEAGTLTRRRTKHDEKTSEEIPTVRYHLWQEILDALQSLPRQSEYVFLTPKGGKLIERRSDYCREQYRPLRKKLGLSLTLKHFRKTGTTIIARKYRGYRTLYLANAGHDITDRHYDGSIELPKKVTKYLHDQIFK